MRIGNSTTACLQNPSVQTAVPLAVLAALHLAALDMPVDQLHVGCALLPLSVLSRSFVLPAFLDDPRDAPPPEPVRPI